MEDLRSVARLTGLGFQLEASEVAGRHMAITALPLNISDTEVFRAATPIVSRASLLLAAFSFWDDEGIEGVSIPNGIPLVYALDAELRPIRPQGAATSALRGVFLGDEAKVAAADWLLPQRHAEPPRRVQFRPA